MTLAVAVAALLLFFGICVAVIFLAARRYGWKPVLLYLFFSIFGRILTHFALSERDQTEQNLIPLIGAGLIVWLLPHVMRHRDLERGGELNSAESNDVSEELE